MDIKRSTLQFKIVLGEIEPVVWRRIEVPASYSFWDLHVAVQDAMGWLDYHLHMFRVGNPVSGVIDEIGIPDEDAVADAPVCLPGWEVPIARCSTASGSRRATNTISVMVGLTRFNSRQWGAGRAGTKYPRCLNGRRACPPEDSGGPYGYAHLLSIIADPADEEHESMMEWLGGSFDPEAFSPTRVRFDNPKRRRQIAFHAE